MVHWDVNELLEMKENITKNGELSIGLVGWPKLGEAVVVALNRLVRRGR
jgi:hypothetical protein